MCTEVDTDITGVGAFVGLLTLVEIKLKLPPASTDGQDDEGKGPPLHMTAVTLQQ